MSKKRSSKRTSKKTASTQITEASAAGGLEAHELDDGDVCEFAAATDAAAAIIEDGAASEIVASQDADLAVIADANDAPDAAELSNEAVGMEAVAAVDARDDVEMIEVAVGLEADAVAEANDEVALPDVVEPFVLPEPDVAETGPAVLLGDDGDEDLPASAAAMTHEQLTNLIEALVFATDKPLTIQRIRQLTRVSDTKRIEASLRTLSEVSKQRGIVLTSVSGGFQFRTHHAYSAWVQQLIAGRPVRLSRAQLETLAIIAYRQPITRPEIDEIRGVDSGGTLKVLLDRSLIRGLGKKEEVGRPVLYGTTKEFLDFFSLRDLRELPTLREYSELTDESRVIMRKMGLDEEVDTATDTSWVPDAATEDATSSTAGDDEAAAVADSTLPSWVVEVNESTTTSARMDEADDAVAEPLEAANDGDNLAHLESSEVNEEGEWVAQDETFDAADAEGLGPVASYASDLYDEPTLDATGLREDDMSEL